MKEKRNKLSICILIIFLSILSCTKKEIEPKEEIKQEKKISKIDSIKVKEIKLKESSGRLLIGENLRLVATLLPENSTVKKIKWSINNKQCATVDEEGLITAIKEGEAVITGKADEIEAEFKLRVEKKAIPVSAISFGFTSHKIEIGKEMTFSVVITPSDATNKKVEWSSSNEDIAIVNSVGHLQALAIGKTTITAKCSNKSCTCEIEVLAKTIHVEELIIVNTDMHMGIGDSDQAQATVSPQNATNKTITWTSSNPDVASISTDGLINGISEGESIITATADEKTANFTVYVSSFVYIPDREFARALRRAGIDRNGDGKFSFKEAEAIWYLNLNNYDITDLTGLEAFKNLQTLKCARTKITKLDVSHSKLRHLDIRSCNDLEVLNCSNIEYKRFSLNGYRSLTKLKEIDLSNSYGITTFDCEGLNFTSVNLSNCKDLYYVYCVDMSTLKTLNLDNCTKLNEIVCEENSIEELCLKNCGELRILNCSNNNLKSLDISDSPKMEWIGCINNPDLKNIYVLDIDFANENFDKDETSSWIKK